MKKFLPTFIVAFLTASFLMGQSVENGGFEEWEDAGTVIDEPVNWSSIKTSDAGDLINNAAPVVWGQSDDAHNGNYSVELKNVLTLGTIIATGTVTNGRIHAEFDPNASYSYTDPDDARWHTPYTNRPDSIVIWVKYTPAGSDTAQVKALLHTGEGSLPPTPENQSNWIGYAQINITGNVNNWTRYAAPFEYFSGNDPEYVLFVLTSGAGTVAVEGSVVYYDDLELVGEASGIGENNDPDFYVYAFNNNLYLDKVPDSYLKNATIRVFNLNGSEVWSVKPGIHQSRIKHPLDKGLYVLKIEYQSGTISQKLYIR